MSLVPACLQSWTFLEILATGQIYKGPESFTVTARVSSRFKDICLQMYSRLISKSDLLVIFIRYSNDSMLYDLKSCRHVSFIFKARKYIFASWHVCLIQRYNQLFVTIASWVHAICSGLHLAVRNCHM